MEKTVQDLEVGDVVTAMGTKVFDGPLTVAQLRRHGGHVIGVFLGTGLAPAAFWPMQIGTAAKTTVTVRP